jgi:hypothetical protein
MINYMLSRARQDKAQSEVEADRAQGITKGLRDLNGLVVELRKRRPELDEPHAIASVLKTPEGASAYQRDLIERMLLGDPCRT